MAFKTYKTNAPLATMISTGCQNMTLKKLAKVTSPPCQQSHFEKGSKKWQWTRAERQRFSVSRRESRERLPTAPSRPRRNGAKMSENGPKYKYNNLSRK